MDKEESMRPSLKNLKPVLQSLRRKEVLVLAASVVVVTATALAAGVNPLGTPTFNPGTRQTTFSWTVTPVGTESDTDFHIRTTNGTKLPKIVGKTEPNGWTQSHNAADGVDYWQGSSHGSSAITTANNPPTNPAVFTLTFSDQDGHFTNPANLAATVVVTVTGSNVVTSTVGTIVTTGSGGGHLPVAYIAPEDKSIGWGCGTSVALGSTEFGESYHVYALSSVSGCPDPWVDFAGFLTYAAGNPVAGIAFGDMTGTLDADGAGAISVSVPADLVLHGQHFFLVATVEETVDGAASNVYSWPAHEYTVD
jgi:hypothetical protein